MKRIYTGAVVLLIAVAMIFSSVAIAANTKISNKNLTGENNLMPITKNINFEKPVTQGRGIIFEDDFESYEDFVLDFPPWTQLDVDGADTYGMTNYDYPNEGYMGSYIIFNPSLCTPPVPDAPPHSGEKYAACFNAVLPASNDDWLISPQLSSTDFGEVSFWARAYTDAYNLDRFEVGISTTDTDPSSFTIISDPPYVEATIDWTEYVYDISSYSGDIYIGIHCVSNDAFFLMIDDFKVDDGKCDPSVDLEKYVWDEINQEWLDADTIDTALDAPICDDVTFKIVIHNTGDCPLFFINVSDHMHESLKYTGADPEPDNHWFDDEAKEWRMYWFFPGPLNPDETIEIYVTAHVEGPECSTDYNWAHVGALCEHGIYVEDEDESWVHAYKKSKDLNMPFLQFLHNHPNIFPLLQKLLNTLGL